MTITSRISMFVLLCAAFAPVACGTGPDSTSIDEGAAPDEIVVTSGDLEGEVTLATRAPLVQSEDGLSVQGSIDGEPAELRLESVLEDPALDSSDLVEKEARRPPVGGGGGPVICLRCTNCQKVGDRMVCDCTEIPCPVLTLAL